MMGIYTRNLDNELRTSRRVVEHQSVSGGTATTNFVQVESSNMAVLVPPVPYPTLRYRTQIAASAVTIQDFFQEIEPENISLVDSITTDETQEMITYLEDKYKMSSKEFLRRWELGEMPDNFETNYWAILVK